MAYTQHIKNGKKRHDKRLWLKKEWLKVALAKRIICQGLRYINGDCNDADGDDDDDHWPFE